MNTHAKIPIRITGYGSPRAEHDTAPEPQIREYFVGSQETPIAVVKVMWYADENRIAGFMFEGQIYQTESTVDAAVGGYVVMQLLHAYETILAPVPNISIPFVQRPSTETLPFEITTGSTSVRGERWTHARTPGETTKKVLDHEWDEATEQILRDRSETWKELADL